MLFAEGIWLFPDPNGGRFVWAHAQTPILNAAGLLDAEGRSLAEGFPRVYNVIATEARGTQARAVPAVDRPNVPLNPIALLRSCATRAPAQVTDCDALRRFPRSYLEILSVPPESKECRDASGLHALC